MLLKIFGFKYYLFTYMPICKRGKQSQCIVIAKNESEAVWKFISKRFEIGAFTYESAQEINCIN